MLMKASFVISFIALSATPAVAQPVQHPPVEPAAPAVPALDLAVSVNGDIAAETVRTALAAELGVRIVDGPSAAIGRLEVATADGMVRITFRPAQGEAVERMLPLPARADDRVQLVTFVATNLVRDQISALLAALAIPPAPTQAPIEIPTPPPTVAPIARPAEHHIAASIGLIPPLSLDRIAGEQVTVGVGVHAAIGSAAGSTIASVSGAVDIKTQYMRGVQIAGAASIVGGRADGLQIAGAATAARDVVGGQIAGAATVARDVEGLQIAGAATLARHIEGFQVAGATTIASDIRGAQVAGGIAIADRVDGLQVAGGANIAGSVDGAQIGVVNVARRMRGLQLGVINVANNSDDSYPIGLLNFTRNGRVEVDGWLESTRMSALALRHGPKHIQNILAIGWSPDEDHVMAGLGLGYHGSLGVASLDIDALNWWTNVWHGDLEQLDQLRATVAVPVGAFAVFAGAAANVYVNDGMDESANFHPVVARRTMTETGVHVVAWPSVFAGVRMFVR